MLEKLLKRDELAMKLNVLAQISNELAKNLALTEKLKEDIEKEDLENKELIFKFSDDILMSNKGYFLVRFGNVFLEKNKEELLAFLEKKKEKLKSRIESIKKELERINKEIESISINLQI